VIDLLLAIAEGWGADGSTIEQVWEPLKLAPSLTTTLGTCLVVGVNLVRDVEKVLGKLFTKRSKLLVSLVTHHVNGLPVDGVVCEEEDIGPCVVEAAKATISVPSDCTNNNTSWVRICTLEFC
jgi:hypothetical protein